MNPPAYRARPGVRVAAGVAWRLGRVALHLATGLATVAVVYPVAGHALRLRLKQRCSARLLARLGVDLECPEAMPAAAAPCAMIVANHISWLDIFVINALRPAAIVCKDEVRGWPVIGWLCARTDSIFIARGSARDARQVGGQITALPAPACAG